MIRILEIEEKGKYDSLTGRELMLTEAEVRAVLDPPVATAVCIDGECRMTEAELARHGLKFA